MKKKIMMLSVLPIFLMASAIMLFTVTLVRTEIENDVERTLKGVSVAVIAAYEQNSGDYMELNGSVWKGEFDISKSEELLDSIKENSGIDVTFCYGTRSVVTSVTDSAGNRILDSEVGEDIANQVLDNHGPEFSKKVRIGEEDYYGYYMPVYQNGTDEVIGMVFAGAPKGEENKTFIAILKILAGVSVFFLVVYYIISNLSAVSINNAIEAANRAVKEVASGQLTVEIQSKYLHRKDAIGELCRSVDGMKNELRFIIEDINDNTKKLLNSADSLGGNAQSTLETVDNVDHAVNEIAEGATSQAKDTVRASENVALMGDLLEITNQEIDSLDNNAQVMKNSSEQATRSLSELMKINQEVMNAIHLIYEQTNQTNESSQKIKEATNIISNISDETNLLSLNASIEAARAGEQGRGFAVVANEIQHLAEQSGASTNEIAAMVNELIADSDRAVEAMTKVNDIIMEQSRDVEKTQLVVQEVIRAIEASLQSITLIKRQSTRLNDAKDEIVRVVESLSSIAEENAASTEETSAATTEVANSFNEVTEAAGVLKDIADSIAGTVETFKLQ